MRTAIALTAIIAISGLVSIVCTSQEPEEIGIMEALATAVVLGEALTDIQETNAYATFEASDAFAAFDSLAVFDNLDIDASEAYRTAIASDEYNALLTSNAYATFEASDAHKAFKVAQRPPRETSQQR